MHMYVIMGSTAVTVGNSIPGRELLLGKGSLASKTTMIFFFSFPLFLLDSEGPWPSCPNLSSFCGSESIINREYHVSSRLSPSGRAYKLRV